MERSVHHALTYIAACYFSSKTLQARERNGHTLINSLKTGSKSSSFPSKNGYIPIEHLEFGAHSQHAVTSSCSLG